MFKCPRCNQNYPSYRSLSKHTNSAYKLFGEELYREYHKIKEIPTCKCGCGTPTKWRSDRGYAEYVTGHNAKGNANPMFGKTHSEKARNNISTKRKEKFASGEYTFIDSEKWSNAAKKVWEREDYRENMQLARENSGWKQKLSKAKLGKNNPWYGKKRPEHSKLMKTSEMLEKIFAKRSLTNIEQLMMEILDQLKIDYYSQFFITHESNTYAYDFKLKNIPILIEVDGDYWHGGPSVDKHVSHLNEVQQNDVVKNKIALEHGYTLLRFWGSDITERPFWVTQQLLQKINQPT